MQTNEKAMTSEYVNQQLNKYSETNDAKKKMNRAVNKIFIQSKLGQIRKIDKHLSVSTYEGVTLGDQLSKDPVEAQ